MKDEDLVKNKKLFLALGVLVVAILLAGWSYSRRTQAREFVGVVSLISDNSAILQGSFVTGKSIFENFPGDKVTIFYDANTRIYREVDTMHRLNSSDSPTTFSPSSNSKDIKQVSISDLKMDWKAFELNKRDLVVNVKSVSDIYKKNSFKIDQMTYIIPVVK